MLSELQLGKRIRNMPHIGGPVAAIALIVILLMTACTPAASTPTPKPVAATPTAAGQPAATAPAPAATPTVVAQASAPTAQAKPKNLEKMKVGNITTSLYLPVFLAQVLGYYQQEGLDVELVEFASGADISNAIIANQVDASVGVMLQPPLFKQQNQNVKAFFKLQERGVVSAVVQKKLVDSGQVKTLKDLAGPKFRVGITRPGSGTWQHALYWFGKAGVKPEEINFVSVGAGTSAIGAFRSGNVDVLVFGDPENIQLVQEGLGTFLVDLNDEKQHEEWIGKTFVDSIMIAKESYLAQNPAKAQALSNALQRALNYILATSPEQLATESKKWPAWRDFESKLLVDMIKHIRVSFAKDGVITRDAFDNMMKFETATGVIPSAPKYEEVIDTAFADKAKGVR